MILSVLGINFLAVFFHDKFKVRPAAALLCSLFFGLALLSLSAMLAQQGLFIATVAYFVIATVLFVFTVIKSKEWSSYLSTTVKLVNFATLIFFLIYHLQQPMFYYWDEYSFWGTAAMVTKELDALYTYTPYILTHLNGIPPITSVLSYLMQFFAFDFYDHSVYFAYAFLAISVFGAVTELIEEKTKQHFLTPVIFLLFLLSVFLQTYHLPSADYDSLSYGYGTAMADFNIAIIAIGVLAIYFGNTKSYFFATGLIPMILIKDVGVIFAVLIICVVFVFSFLSREKKFVTNLVGFALCIALVPSIYFAWDRHVNTIYAENSLQLTITDEIVERQDLEYYNLPIEEGSGSEEEHESSPTVTENMRNILREMLNQFRASSMIGFVNDYIMLVIMVLLGVVSIVFAKKSHRPALLLANIGFLAGMVLYALALSFFITGFSDDMVEYPRYLMPYFFIYLYFNFIACLIVVTPRFRKGVSISVVALVILLCANLLYIGTDYTFISSPENAYADAKVEKAAIERYGSLDGNTLLISNRFNDYHYLTNQKFFFPNIVNYNRYFNWLDYSMGFSDAEHITDETSEYFIVATIDEFLAIYHQNFDYIYVSHPQTEFVESYGELFVEKPIANTLYYFNSEIEMFEEVAI